MDKTKRIVIKLIKEPLMWFVAVLLILGAILVVNFSSEETKLLNSENICHLVIFDRNGKQKTLKQSISFDTLAGVI